MNKNLLNGYANTVGLLMLMPHLMITIASGTTAS